MELESRVGKAREGGGWEDKFKLNGTELVGLLKIWHLLKSSMEKWTWESPGSLGLAWDLTAPAPQVVVFTMMQSQCTQVFGTVSGASSEACYLFPFSLILKQAIQRSISLLPLPHVLLPGGNQCNQFVV